MAEAYTVVQLIRAGLVRPWSWDEWQALPAQFATDVLVAQETVNQVEAAKAEGQRTGR